MHAAAVACLLCILPLAAVEPPSADLTRPAVMRAMTTVADWQLAQRLDVEPDGKPRALTDWTNGVLYTGVMALARIAPDDRYSAAMRRIGDQVGWTTGPRKFQADDYCVAQMFTEMYLKYREPQMIASLVPQYDAILARTYDDDFTYGDYSREKVADKWIWLDALFMGPSSFVRLSAATGDDRYRDFAARRWWLTADHLWDPEVQLHYRDDRYRTRREVNGARMFWSRASGWYFGGSARMIPYLPTDHPLRPRFIERFQAMAKALLPLQTADGTWHTSLLAPDLYPNPETSGTGFFVFGFAWGVNEGLLDRATFMPAIEKGWKGLVSCIRPDGRLGYVQPIGNAPRKVDADMTEAYGTGAFLLAGSEVWKMAKP